MPCLHELAHHLEAVSQVNPSCEAGWVVVQNSFIVASESKGPAQQQKVLVVMGLNRKHLVSLH